MSRKLAIEPAPDGVLLPVQAQPKARRNGIAGIHAGRLKVAVTAAPERGKANAAILEVLADALGLRKSQLSVSAGATAAAKKILITGITPAELHKRLAPWMDPADSRPSESGYRDSESRQGS